MEDNKALHVLGCVPMGLNILFEIAEAAKGINSFKVYKNMPTSDIYEAFKPQENWKVEIYDQGIEDLVFTKQAFLAFSVVGVKSKEKVYKWFKKQTNIEKSQFVNLIHPMSYVSKSVQLNDGLQIEPQCTIAACAKIGFGVNIKRNSSIGHHCQIDDFVTINPGVTISSYVKIGSNTMIGSGVTIKNNTTIGNNCIIGVGSVVVKDIPSNSIAYGNPCKVHKQNA
ncbi:acetyltransferase [Seonamhaeicola marinus]|uniref:Acetyltransferase n=1 Tax=Seonamhaeicola marinus TaxID=1912246 RepID=A0A5D0IKF6_9FLAO|nr:acetyltransferase [Seonamhaeicola marinus]TYA84265.1 acetyltransferase [Seonamhaeicola marinus]